MSTVAAPAEPSAAPAVSEPVVETGTESGPSVKRTLILTMLLVTLLIFVGVTLGIYLYTDETAAAFGIGALVAIWAGPGFGAMASAAVLSWQEDHGDDAH